MPTGHLQRGLAMQGEASSRRVMARDHHRVDARVRLPRATERDARVGHEVYAQPECRHGEEL